MQQLYYNNRDLTASGLSYRTNIDPVISTDYAFNFPSREDYFVIDGSRVDGPFGISLKLRTTQSEGVVLYMPGANSKNYLMAEIHNSRLELVYNFEGNHSSLRNPMRVDDNKWHSVQIAIYKSEGVKLSLILRVDEKYAIKGMNENTKFKTSGKVWVGGVEDLRDLPSKNVKSRRGYQGCLANLNGIFNLKPYANILTLKDVNVHGNVESGCSAPENKCGDSTCKNQGVCILHPTRVSCDCEMTSFVGNQCDQHAISYAFHNEETKADSESSFMVYDIDLEHPASNLNDTISFGIKTTDLSGDIIKLQSSHHNFFIKIELTQGNILASFNLGGEKPASRLYLLSHVSDGQYHVVRFRREAQKAWLQVDRNENIEITKKRGKVIKKDMKKKFGLNLYLQEMGNINEVPLRLHREGKQLLSY
ncbi:DgyrCDS2040 [Dimorphilus gyrociliatus]|uniref:DgyrCDS2040 n=1 Tax=Dimorphilus gyrociliatus TaxID=2664684 RepID=A0A7I8VC70_9ANNE|nr:DgyrCDS2040 [Dimorphilus gyrociliatus]